MENAAFCHVASGLLYDFYRHQFLACHADMNISDNVVFYIE